MSIPELDIFTDEKFLPESELHSVEKSPRTKLDYYLYIREKADRSHIATDEELSQIHKITEGWIIDQGFDCQGVDYEYYDSSSVREKMLGLCDFMMTNYPHLIDVSIVEATRAFIDASFSMYEDSLLVPKGEKHPDVDGSFAFVVPMRVSRFREDYGQEVEKISPILRYIPNKYRALFAIGLPPLVLDQYKVDESGKRGYLILAPVYGDMMVDLALEEADRVANKNINDAVDFANKRIGADIVGLGAVLPAVTRFGATIDNKDVITTTGHGGTTHLILETVQHSIDKGYVDPNKIQRKGVLGLGSIGASIAHLIGDKYKGSELYIYDSKDHKVKRVLADLGKLGIKATAVQSAAELINNSDIIISAITGEIDLSMHPDVFDLTKKIIIDDSQPGCFKREQVEALGGFLTWVIGSDVSSQVQRLGYDYGTLADSQSDLFGCEGEAAALAMYGQELTKRGFDNKTKQRLLNNIALSGPVTPEKARIIGALFKKYGISPAQFQVFGEYIGKP